MADDHRKPAPSAAAGVPRDALAVVDVSNGAITTELAKAADSARRYVGKSKSANTKRAYKRVWEQFTAWCERNGQTALPAAPAAVAAYLAQRADEGKKVATIKLDLAAINAAHVAAGYSMSALGRSIEVSSTMGGIEREHGEPQRRVKPLLPAQLEEIVTKLELVPGLRSTRDKAILLIGFAGCFRRSEVVALEVRDLEFSAEGVQITLRRSKTDQKGEGLAKAVKFGGNAATCPVRALQAWLAVAKITEGPIFREIDVRGQIGTVALCPQTIADIVKRYVALIGADATAYSGHSMRAGLATAAAKAGARLDVIKRQGGWKTTDIVERYIREAELFDENAGDGLL